MQRSLSYLLLAFSVFFLASCGEEYYSTPEKTLQRYVDNRYMANRQEYEAALNAFRKEDKEWWNQRYMKMCSIFYGQDCPGEGLSTEVTIWTDRFEPAGPNNANVESSNIDEKAGTATLVVDGQEIQFVKERGNWKIKGFFGVQEQLAEKYTELQ